MKPSRQFATISVLALITSLTMSQTSTLAAPSQQSISSAMISLSSFSQNPVMVGDAIPLDLTISVTDINPGVAGAEIYLSYNPVLVSLSKTQGSQDFFSAANVSINEVLLAEKCPGGASPCLHLVLAGSAQTTKTGLAASFQFTGIKEGTACFGVTGSKMVDVDGFEVSLDAAPEQCITLKPTLTQAKVLRQGMSASPNPSGGSLACTSVTANGTASGMHSATTDQNGEFRMDNLAIATYTVRASYPGYLDSETQNVTVNSSLVMHLETPTLVGGDVNGDGAINILDIGTIVSKFGQAGVAMKSASVDCSVTDESSDINDDGLINISDLAITAGNWGKVGTTGSITHTPTFTPTTTGSPTITITPTFTFTATPTVTMTPTFTPTPTNTAVSDICTTVTEIPSSECNALVALYNSTNGSGWENKTGWLVSNTPCSWFGITCSNGHVIEIFFNNNQLRGSIPSDLGNLTNLINLELSMNQLSGSIPAELGNLTNLMNLRLYTNQLTGGIPAELGSLTNLTELDLGGNQFTGNIPPELGNLTNLTYLYLGWNQFSQGGSGNQLTGSIPAELGSLTNLTELDLKGNQLTGSIPPELGDLTNLTDLHLYGNQLTSIPVELGNLTNLTYLDLGENQLIGGIPPELGNLTNLKGLSLHSNQLSGSIPPELGNLTNLTELWLNSNQLSGSIPLELGNLTNLKGLNLDSNQLIGNIPPELGNLTQMRRLYLDVNLLSGSIPDSLRNLIVLNDFTYPSTVCVPNTPEFTTWLDAIDTHTTPYTLCH